MDDIVRQAMVKWPNVPHCHGWLGLDARGNWYLRDAQAQALGGFASGVAGARGTRLLHQRLIEFIQRNYAADEAGRWFFQNGPQRVYVELELTPMVWRVGCDFTVTAHTGAAGSVRSSVLDEQGRLYLECDIGFGLVHTQDMGLAADAVEQGLWTPHELPGAQMPGRFGYVRSPQNAAPMKKAGH